MLKTRRAEWLLARATDRTRAAAMVGDLTEMAATRGRLWFWVAYARTLLSIIWRNPVALVAASAFTYLLGPIVWKSMRTLFRLRPHISAQYHHVSFLYAILGNALLGLFFLLPFVLIRFGMRDPLTRLACAVFVLTLPYFSLVPTVVLVVGPLLGVAFIAALCRREWRRPMLVLVLALVPQYAFITVYMNFPHSLLFFHLHGWMMVAPRLAAFTITAVVCLYLHRWLLQRPPITDRKSANSET